MQPELESNLPLLQVSCALIYRDGLLLAARRSPTMPDPGLWEFPGGKVEPGESPAACLAREIQEELGVRIAIEKSLSPVRRRQAKRILELLPFCCRLLAGEPQPHEHAEIFWATPAHLLTLTWIPADLDILQQVV
ncbi:MAG TPA: (deoxy)nucleoside triphosphate pyrophosphohydrolase [Candidatus Obscuribacterales bacterium]